MDFVCKLYGNTYAVHVTVALVGVATLNLALPAPLSVNVIDCAPSASFKSHNDHSDWLKVLGTGADRQ